MTMTIATKVTFVKADATRIGRELANKEIRNELQAAYDRLVDIVAATYRQKKTSDIQKALAIAAYARRMGAIERAIALL